MTNIEGKSHFLGLAGSTLANAAQEVLELLCCKDTLLAYIQLVHKDPQGLSCRAAAQLVSSQPILL